MDLRAACIGVGLLSSALAFAAPAPGETAMGHRIYQLYCATCHGARGDGRGPTARFVEPAPQDFTRGAYKLRSTPAGSLPTDDDLARTVRRGVPGTSMPAWGGLLGEGEIRAVISTIRGFSSREAVAAAAVELPAGEPPPSAESIQRGRSVYLLMMCWKCHGAAGRGDGPDAPTLKDDRGLPISPRDFGAGLFKGGGTPGDLYRTLATGMDGTPMVAFFADPGVLARSLVLFRSSFESELATLGGLDDGQRQDLQQFIAGLPAAEAFDEMEDEEQAKLVEGWQWDLVHYIRSLSGGTFSLRKLLGIEPMSTLYGADAQENGR